MTNRTNKKNGDRLPPHSPEAEQVELKKMRATLRLLERRQRDGDFRPLQEVAV